MPADPKPLDVQIAIEQAEIANAPRVSIAGNIGVCHWCGRISQNLVPVEIIGAQIIGGQVVGGQTRYKGACCNGGHRHG